MANPKTADQASEVAAWREAHPDLAATVDSMHTWSPAKVPDSKWSTPGDLAEDFRAIVREHLPRRDPYVVDQEVEVTFTVPQLPPTEWLKWLHERATASLGIDGLGDEKDRS